MRPGAPPKECSVIFSATGKGVIAGNRVVTAIRGICHRNQLIDSKLLPGRSWNNTKNGDLMGLFLNGL
jgi:hypothetical protein